MSYFASGWSILFTEDFVSVFSFIKRFKSSFVTFFLEAAILKCYCLQDTCKCVIQLMKNKTNIIFYNLSGSILDSVRKPLRELKRENIRIVHQSIGLIDQYQLVLSEKRQTKKCRSTRGNYSNVKIWLAEKPLVVQE